MDGGRVVTVRLRVPPWLSDEDIERLVRGLEEELWDQIPVEYLRRVLGVRDEDLTYDVEVIDWESLEEKEKKRIEEILAHMA